MQKCLYLICPTDRLESIINNTFKCENYFYASLGNSFIFDSKTIEHIRQVIKKHNIRKIYFVLSKDNQIILDALGNQYFSNIKGLNNFYNEITKQKERSEIASKRSNRKFSLLSYYLNKKVKELQLQLNNLSNQPIVSGKVYSRYQDAFTNIYSDLVCLDKYHLN